MGEALLTRRGGARAGVNLRDIITVVFHDCDDVLLGSMAVERGDARQAVSEYIEQNFIHPDLRASSNPGASYTDSLERQYNYRGIFAAEGPQTTDTIHGSVSGTRDENGGAYPLTNKLDYVFYKRETAHAGTYDPDADNAWSVAPVGGGGEGKFPYAYGWALVEDATNIADVWTTIGMGELGGITMPQSADKKTATSGNFTTLSSRDAGYFQFADFSNLNIDDYPESYLVVKAVYEPGELLYSSAYSYTLIKNPEYTKDNTQASTNNAVYPAKLTLARRYQEGNGGVRGVARARQPVVRVHITPDLLIVGVSNTLSRYFNARVDVENKDVIDVNVMLAAAIHSVDYTLVDLFGSHLDAASSRSTAKSLLTAEQRIMDNFDYTIIREDYSRRLGTPGFVYTSTMAILLEWGSKLYYEPDVSANQTNFNNHCSFGTMHDINIRGANGLELTGDSFLLLDIRAKTRNAIAAAIAAGSVDENGYAVMSYHQLQHYILEGQFMSDAWIDEYAPILWCRQHQECIDRGLGTPNTVPALLEAVRDARQGDSSAMDRINTLYLDRIDGDPFYFKRDANATAFGTFDDFIDKILTIYNATGFNTNLSWTQVQYFLINNTIPSETTADNESNTKYWWRDGDSKITNLATMLTAVQNNKHDTALRVAWDSDLISGNTTGTGKLYLRQAGGTPFASFTAFKSAIADIMDDAAAAGLAALNWAYVQYYLAHGGTFASEADMAQWDKDTAWWYNGGVQIGGATYTAVTTSILTAAKQANSGRNAMLNTLTPAFMASSNLRADFAGASFNADMVDFKAAMRNISALGVTSNWVRAQYIIIHGVVNSSAENTESNEYYWWRTGGAPTAIEFSGNANQLVTAAAKAAYRATFNGNYNAWNQFTADSLATIKLIPSQSGWESVADFGNFTKFANTTELTTKMSLLMNLIRAANGESGEPVPTEETLTWLQAQHYLLTGNYLTASDPTLPGDTVYWWRTMNVNEGPDPDPTGHPEIYYELFLKYMGRAIQNNDYTILRNWLHAYPEALMEMGFINASYEMFDESNYVDILWDLPTWGDGIVNSGYYDAGTGTVDLTWHQIQACLAWAYYEEIFTPEECEEWLGDEEVFAPDWWVEYTSGIVEPLVAPLALQVTAEGHSRLYEVLRRVVARRGANPFLRRTVDRFRALDKLTAEQYTELIEMLEVTTDE